MTMNNTRNSIKWEIGNDEATVFGGQRGGPRIGSQTQNRPADPNSRGELT
jgi:hypothetical protein